MRQEVYQKVPLKENIIPLELSFMMTLNIVKQLRDIIPKVLS